ncbi:TPA: hypothetical protein ACKMRM_002032, partial [Neisseria gonorrhoeae]
GGRKIALWRQTGYIGFYCCLILMMLFFPKDFNRLKIIAYTSPDGDEWVTALEAKLKHREGMIYYSRHRPGTRKKMVLTRRKATNFFRYYSEADSGGASAPESLTHLLCKQVLNELSNLPGGLTTVLNCTEHAEQQPPVTIRLNRALSEYRIDIDGKTFYIDVLLEFDQPGNTSLLRHEIRWQRKLAVEIWHTSRLASNAPKCLALSKIGIPVVQIRADKGSFLYIDEDELLNYDNEEIKNRINRHVEKLRNTFRKQILCTLLRNPLSADFQTALMLHNQIKADEQQAEQIQEKFEALRNKHVLLEAEYSALAAQYAALLEHQNFQAHSGKREIPKKHGILQRMASWFKS